jgi:ubiquinone/menaquinone biosynthesis C-methylase UbiE
MNSNDLKSYVLKDKEDHELSRLGFQHRVWLEETVHVLKRAGFGLGQTIIDLGCGPGYLSFDLSKIVGSKGHIIAIDNSEKFIHHISEKINNEKYSNVSAHLIDITKLELESKNIDGAVARWVMMFIEDVEIVIQRVANSLKPNGIFVVMDYFQFRTMSLWPGKQSFEKVYCAVYELIKQHGGDADIGGHIPQLLSQCGFKILDIYPIFRVGRPGSLLWDWLEMIGKNHGNLVEAGILTEVELQEYYADWAESSKNPNAFFTAPPVLVTIGMKL